MSRRRAVVAILLALTFVLISSTGEARDRTETCTSYTAMGGTTTTEPAAAPASANAPERPTRPAAA